MLLYIHHYINKTIIIFIIMHIIIIKILSTSKKNQLKKLSQNGQVQIDLSKMARWSS